MRASQDSLLEGTISHTCAGLLIVRSELNCSEKQGQMCSQVRLTF